MSGVILAIRRDGVIVGALDPAKYKGADRPYPNGWKELIDADVKFDQNDLDCVCEEQADAILRQYHPCGYRKPKLKTSFVDVVVRVKVTHAADEDATEVVSEAAFKTTLPHADLKVMDMVTAGTCDEANGGVLIREDGGTGRDAHLVHDPPID